MTINKINIYTENKIGIKKNKQSKTHTDNQYFVKKNMPNIYNQYQIN